MFFLSQKVLVFTFFRLFFTVTSFRRYVEDADTILDALFWSYSETECADSQAVQQYNENLNRLLQCLSGDQMNSIIDTVNDLCWEHDRRGFINGFKLGMRLEQEISQCPYSHN